MSFHQRERCLRGNCVLITRSNGPPVFECTFICLFVSVVKLSHSLLDLFLRKFNDVISSYSEFVCTSDSVCRVFLKCLIFFPGFPHLYQRSNPCCIFSVKRCFVVAIIWLLSHQLTIMIQKQQVSQSEGCLWTVFVC